MIQLLAVLSAIPALGTVPWPAEPVSEAINLTAIEGPGPNDFHVDLSGAVWNPVTRQLWVCRNGPSGTQSKLWAVVENGAGGYQIDYQGNLRGEWTGFGDLEGVTLADFAGTTIFGIIEGEERIKEFDVSTYGMHVLQNEWDTSGCLPGEGGEGIAFIPDSHLAAAGFVDKNGAPYVSQGGMNGLVFVGHQEFGRIYVFDLQRGAGSNAFTTVGEYATGYSEIAELFFDRSTGRLYVLHDAGFDTIEVLDLTSVPVAGSTSCPQVNALRQFNSVVTYELPTPNNYEGLAIVSKEDCIDGGRKLFLTIDDGGADSLLMFQEFTPGCERQVPAVSTAGMVFLAGLLMIVGGACITGRASLAGTLRPGSAGFSYGSSGFGSITTSRLRLTSAYQSESTGRQRAGY